MYEREVKRESERDREIYISVFILKNLQKKEKQKTNKEIKNNNNIYIIYIS